MSDKYTINTAIQVGVKSLANLENPKLEAEILLSAVLNKPRSFLFTWPDQLLTNNCYITYQQYISRRAKGEPTAYILGQQEFWSLIFKLNSHCLIPRPETELLVETACELLNKTIPQHIIDIGTGCGCIALALAHECPQWSINATDISSEALEMAKLNAKELNLTVNFQQGDCFASMTADKYHAVISNPPYIANNDPDIEASTDVYEPHTALYAKDKGLEIIKRIIEQARAYLHPGGYVILEHGWQQAAAVRALFIQYNYQDISHRQDLQGHTRISLARLG